MSDAGYIKLWRRLLDWPLWRGESHEFRTVVVTLMLKANWRDEQRYVAGKLITIPRGSFFARRPELAAECFMTERKFRRIEATLEKDPGDGQFLSLKRSPAGTLYSVVKYEFYQSDTEEPVTQPVTQASPSRHPGVSLLYKKDEEVEEGEEVAAAPAAPSSKQIKSRSGQTVAPGLTLPPEAWRITKLHRELLLKHNPASSCGGPRWSAQRWARDYDKGQRETAAAPLAWELVEQALRFALDSSDPYWRARVTSPAALFAAWDTILGQMQRAGAASEASDDDDDGWYLPGYEPPKAWQ